MGWGVVKADIRVDEAAVAKIDGCEGQMMKRFDMRALLAICFGLLLTAVAHAAPVFTIGARYNSSGELIGAIGDAPPGKYRTMTTTTGVFVGEHGQYLEWLMGFVSGFNAATGAVGHKD
jgi:hypothetical protein